MQHDPPPVTIRDPARPAAATDLLDPEPRRRGPLPAVALVLFLALLGWGSVVNRGAEEVERDAPSRQDAAVRLSLPERFPFVETPGQVVARRSVVVDLQLQLRNNGPREVRIERAGLGEFTFLGELRLLPGQTRDLRLMRTATCTPGGDVPPLDERPNGLAVQVDTLAGLRYLMLQPAPAALDRLTTGTQRACGFLPVEEAVASASGPVTFSDDGFAAPLEILNSAVRPMRLTAVQMAPGLSVELRAENGAPVALPAYVAPSRFGGPPEVTRYELRGRVECARLDPDAERDIGRVAVEVDDSVGGASATRTSLLGDTQALRQLVERVCGVVVYGSRAS